MKKTALPLFVTRVAKAAPAQAEVETKVEAVAGEIKSLTDEELVVLVCNLTGITMQKINLIYHICVNDSEDMIKAGTFETEARKGKF